MNRYYVGTSVGFFAELAAWLRWLGATADPTDGCECLYLPIEYGWPL